MESSTTFQSCLSLAFWRVTRWAAGKSPKNRKRTTSFHSLSGYAAYSARFPLSRVKWDEENAKGQEDDLEALRIKATSIVILYDEATNSIVNFDVEPGFEHQWGYGRQRFLQQSVLRSESLFGNNA